MRSTRLYLLHIDGPFPSCETIVDMDKFLSPTRARQVSDDQQSVTSDNARDMDVGSHDLSLDSHELSSSVDSHISVDSAASVQIGDSDKMAHLAGFFTFDKTHATCAKCGTKLKVTNIIFMCS